MPSAPSPKARSSPPTCACAKLENLKEAGSRGAGLRILIGKQDRVVLHLRSFAGRHRAAGQVGASSWPTSPPKIPTPACPTPTSWERFPATCGSLRRMWRSSRPSSRSNRPARRGGRALAPIRASPIPKARPSTPTPGRHVFANSRGFAGEYRTSYCSLSAVPVAREGESMERDYW